MNFMELAIDPIAFSIGPIPVRWYGLAYMAAFMIGRYHMHWQARKENSLPTNVIDDLLTWLIIGVVVGGRLGYVLFYEPIKYLSQPWLIFMTWQGGMSFHGGVLGVALALYLFSRRTQQNLWILGDLVVAATPIGLGLGRIANFINGELYGRITSAPWGVIFPGGGPWPRHPSQLYEACAEGVCLYLCLYLGRRLRPQRAAGEQVALFLFGYAVARILAELTREPHVATGYLWGHTTLGQWLCLPLIISAFLVWRHATRR